MRTLEEGNKRIQAICESIREDTLEPAKLEAERRVAEGEHRKQELIAEGRREKERLINEARAQIEQERNVFDSSISQASRQAVEALKQKLERDFFDDELRRALKESMTDPAVVAQIIDALVKAIERDGLGVNLAAQVAKDVDPETVNALLAKRVLDRLENGSVKIGDFDGGALISLKDGNMSISLTLEDAKKLLAEHLRKDFRKLIFASV